MNLSNTGKYRFFILIICAGVLAMPSCSTHTGQMAGQGAATGAVAGSVGGLVGALVFGGDPAEAAARGAVWGASTGAVAGAMTGSQVDAAEKQKQDQNLENLKKAIGEDAFNGLAALAECKHDVALAYGKTAAASDNRDHALAGLWLEVLAYADGRQEDQARERFPQLMEKDPDVTSEEKAEEQMRQSLQRLMEIRGEHGLPKVCN
jgi:hypothetical protein